MKKTYTGIDIFKFFFACMIPLLHIPFSDIGFIDILRQYISRLGVPFFFASSGFFLSKSMAARGIKESLIRHEKRIGKLLLVWLVIYSPILVLTRSDMSGLIRELLFLTPAYLWYLSALLFAAIPFCLIRNRKLLWGLSAILYLFGTLIGGSYDWITGGFPAYAAIFLTSRNGLFFALPLMCVGELGGNIPLTSLKKELLPLTFAAAALFAEITFVLANAYEGADCSMYLLLPVFTYFLLRSTMHIRLDLNTAFLRGASVAVYVMQYGFIVVLRKVSEYLSIPLTVWAWVIYFVVIAGGCFCFLVFHKNRILKHLF